MGLDIKAFRGLIKDNDPVLDEYGEPYYDDRWKPGEGMEWSESIWPGKGYPLESQSVYTWEDLFDFSCGSYGFYNMWREYLNKFKGEVAFQELIDFADNEGVIGSVLAAKLRDDFVRYHAEAIEFSWQENIYEWFMEMYCNWETAFVLAANNGAIEFR